MMVTCNCDAYSLKRLTTITAYEKTEMLHRKRLAFAMLLRYTTLTFFFASWNSVNLLRNAVLKKSLMMKEKNQRARKIKNQMDLNQKDQALYLR